MSKNLSPVELIKSNGLFMLIGILVCGVTGYFIAGSDGRALGGGIGAALGLIVGVVLAKFRTGKQ